MPAGRPTDYKPEYAEMARKLTQAFGATDREVADFLDIDEATLYRWKHSHLEFNEALKVGKEVSDIRVEQSLYRRAIGYVHDSEEIFTYKGEVTKVPVTKIYPPETVACIFWLKNRKKLEWRDKLPEDNLPPQDANVKPIAQRIRDALNEIDGLTDGPADAPMDAA